MAEVGHSDSLEYFRWQQLPVADGKLALGWYTRMHRALSAHRGAQRTDKNVTGAMFNGGVRFADQFKLRPSDGPCVPRKSTGFGVRTLRNVRDPTPKRGFPRCGHLISMHFQD